VSNPSEASASAETVGIVRRMPADLANQIAAGEVVERPASAVKELLENAIDAGARRVRVDLEDGGLKLIRVSDDGVGMSRADATLCVERHASSKLTHRSQLFAISTLGFRGEALPSIASVSRFTLLTKPRGAVGGTRVQIEGGGAPLITDASSPPGTEVAVRDLFYNTPARLKFLRADTTEVKHVVEVVQRLSLPHPDIAFHVSHNGRTLLDYPAVSSGMDRIHSVLGDPDSRGVYALEAAEQDGVHASGFFAQPAVSRRTNAAMWMYVNGRYVRDRSIQSAIRVAYEGLIDRSRFPVAVLFLQVPVRAVDVNVHPMKTEVRFHDSQAVFRASRRAFVQSLAACPWRPSSRDSLTSGQAVSAPGPTGPFPVQAALPTVQQTWYGSERIGEAGASQHTVASGAVVQPQQATVARTYLLRDDPTAARPNRSSRAVELSHGDESELITAESLEYAARPAPAGLPGGSLPRGFFENLHFIGTFKANYLLASDGLSLIVVDQHAAHERITYEKLRSSWQSRRAEAQPLLVPRIIGLDSLRTAILHDHLAFFQALGFHLEPFGGQDFALKSVPAILQGASVDALLRDALDELGETGNSRRIDQAIDAVLIRIACHGSVRAGQTLSGEQVLALFRELDRIDFGANCPHGRPVWFRMTLGEIEKRFDRR